MIERDEHRGLAFASDRRRQVDAPHRVERGGDDGAVVMARPPRRASPRWREQVVLPHQPQHPAQRGAGPGMTQSGPHLAMPLAMKCVFRAKSAGDSGMKSATPVKGGKCSTAGRCTALCSSGTTSGEPMPAERVSMRRVREILRLKHGGASDRQIARSLSLARSTVGLTLQRAAAAGLHWPLPATRSDRVLEARLYAGHGRRQGERRKAEPDWAHIHHELRRPGVTLMLLWEEYRQREPDGWMVTGTAAGASCTAPGRGGCRRRCGRPILLANACSSITPARPSI